MRVYSVRCFFFFLPDYELSCHNSMSLFLQLAVDISQPISEYLGELSARLSSTTLNSIHRPTYIQHSNVCRGK